MQKGNALLLIDFEIPLKGLKKRTIKLPYKSMFVNPLTIWWQTVQCIVENEEAMKNA